MPLRGLISRNAEIHQSRTARFDLRSPPCLSHRPFLLHLNQQNARLPFRSYPNFRAFPLGVIVLSFMGHFGKSLTVRTSTDAHARNQPLSPEGASAEALLRDRDRFRSS